MQMASEEAILNPDLIRIHSVFFYEFAQDKLINRQSVERDSN